jgi:hypothetical protein
MTGTRISYLPHGPQLVCRKVGRTAGRSNETSGAGREASISISNAIVYSAVLEWESVRLQVCSGLVEDVLLVSRHLSAAICATTYANRERLEIQQEEYSNKPHANRPGSWWLFPERRSTHSNV